jgi:23S rRNA A2030 N6-methylase RlmJ
MQTKIYDHRSKAGNQGDVIKHIALIAALDRALDEHRGPTFKYADIFAGYAQNPLARGNEWKQGVGKLFERQDLNDNEHTALYKKWYLSRLKPPGGVYPGSSLIAADLCTWKKKKFQLFLWDTGESPIADLKKVFIGQGHSIFHRAAAPTEQEVISADFLLIDPPDGSKETWDSICKFLANRNPAVLVWLPVSANTTKKPPDEDKQSQLSRNGALALNCEVTRVRWTVGGRMIGCQLIYRVSHKAKSALREAVEHVVRIVGWKLAHYG